MKAISFEVYCMKILLITICYNQYIACKTETCRTETIKILMTYDTCICLNEKRKFFFIA